MDKENCKILADELICNMNKQFAQGVKGKQNKTLGELYSSLGFK